MNSWKKIVTAIDTDQLQTLNVKFNNEIFSKHSSPSISDTLQISETQNCYTVDKRSI